LFRFVSVDFLVVSVQSKLRNSLFRYRSETTETNVLFRIVPKLVSVLVSVVSNRNKFRRTPYLCPREQRALLAQYLHSFGRHRVAGCKRWRGIFKGPSKDGGRADFSKDLLASLFNKYLSNKPNFRRIHLAGQYLRVYQFIYRSAFSLPLTPVCGII
jgi:hypothetical protein